MPRLVEAKEAVSTAVVEANTAPAAAGTTTLVVGSMALAVEESTAPVVKDREEARANQGCTGGDAGGRGR